MAATTVLLYHTSRDGQATASPRRITRSLCARPWVTSALGGQRGCGLIIGAGARQRPTGAREGF